MNESAVLEAQDLEVRYGRTTVLDGVSFQVTPGQVCALLGRNGTGKSSLVRCLLGQQKPEVGAARIFGLDSWRHRVALMQRVGVVPETPDAPPGMSPRLLSRLGSQLYERWDAKGFEQRLKRFEVPSKVAFGRLSRGQKAQVMLAFALAAEPEMLILDDPTLGLDAVARRAVFEELVVELADRGITVLMCSHDLVGIESVASQLMVLGRGRILLDQELDLVKHRFRRIVFQRHEGVGARRDDGTDLLMGLEPLVVKSRGRSVEALVAGFDEETLGGLREQRDVTHVEVQSVALEDIIVALVGEGATSGQPLGSGAES